MTQTTLDFEGATYDPAKDRSRLNRQMQAVYDCMIYGDWRTLDEIARITGAPQASVSARLRDFRKPRFGGFTVDRKRLQDGLYIYRLRKSDAERDLAEI